MADTPETGKPSSTIRIEKTIRNAPVDEEEMEVLTEGKRSSRGPKQSIPGASDQDTPDDEFARDLQDHTVKIHADRVSPREWKGKAISGMIEEYVPPTTIEEVETDIRNRFGGGRYRIRILKNGKFKGARGLNIYGDPKIEDDEFDPTFGEEFNPGSFGPPPGPPVIDDDLVSLRKEIEKEKLKQALEEIKQGRSSNHARPAEDPERIRRDAEERIRREMDMRREVDSVKTEVDKKIDNFISSMKDMLRSQKETDPGREADIVQLDNKIERIKTEVMGEIKSTFSEIRSMLQAKQVPEKPDTTPQLLQAIIEGFSKMSGSSETKLHAIATAESAKTHAMMETMKAINEANAKVAQAQTDKLVTVLQSQGGQGIGEMSKTIGAVRDMAETLGWAPGGGDGEVAQPPDMMTRIMGMIEKALPSLLAANAAKSRQTGGQQLDQQEIQNIIGQQARAAAQQIAVPMAEKIAAERIAQMQVQQRQADHQRQIQPQPQPRPVTVPINTPVPTPAPVTTSSSPPVAQPVQEQPVQGQIPEPVLATDHGTAAPVAPQPIPAQPEPVDPVHQEKCQIVNDCMEILMKEVHIRPRKPEWNEMAFEELPEEVLDQLVMVTDADGLLRVINPYAKPEYIKELETVFAADQRTVDWFVRTINELKTMYAEENQETEAKT
jgi:hypothetical protein